MLTRVLFVLVAVCSPVRADEQRSELGNAPALVDGVLARASAVLSGRFEYQLTDGFKGNPKLIHDSRYRLSLRGESWAVRTVGFPGTRINHRGKLLKYVTATELATGKVGGGATIYSAEAIDTNRPCPPYFAGTLWYRETAEFVKANRDSARAEGRSRVNGIETTVLAFDVSVPNLKFLMGICDEMAASGVLRLHVAESLGYALPLIEYVDLLGVTTSRFESRNFREVSPGIFFPWKCEYVLKQDAADSYYARYDMYSAELVNEDIPEDDFVMTLPLGTAVADSRTPGGSTVFRVGEESQLPADLGEISRIVTDQSARTWSPAFFAVNAAILAVLACLGSQRYFRRMRAARSTPGGEGA